MDIASQLISDGDDGGALGLEAVEGSVLLILGFEGS